MKKFPTFCKAPAENMQEGFCAREQASFMVLGADELGAEGNLSTGCGLSLTRARSIQAGRWNTSPSTAPVRGWSRSNQEQYRGQMNMVGPRSSQEGGRTRDKHTYTMAQEVKGQQSWA